MKKGYGTRRIGMEGGSNAVCDNPLCGKPFYRTPAQLKGRKYTYCSRECYYTDVNNSRATVVFDAVDQGRDAEPLQIRIELKSEDRLQFERVKKALNEKYNTQVFRKLLYAKYVELFGDEFNTEPKTLTQAQRLMLEDFVNRNLIAINKDPDTLRKLMKDDLYFWDWGSPKLVEACFKHAEAYFLEDKQE